MYQAVINSEVPAIMPAFLCLCLNDFYNIYIKGH